MNSVEYEMAYEKSTAACKVFRQAQADYRARRIGDAEFLAARKVYDAAMAEFDVAYAKEQDNGQ